MATTKIDGFTNLRCPECGESEARIMMDLFDVGECECKECGSTFTIVVAVKKASEALDAWKKIERLSELARQLAAE
jgi:transcription elongation factor Elf1